MGSLAAISLCVLLALTLYDGVDGDDSSHNIQARHFGGGGRRGGWGGRGHGIRGGGPGRWGGHVHGGRPARPPPPPPRPQPPPQPQVGGFFKMFLGFLKMFPMFSNVQTQNRQQACNYIINTFKQQPNLMKDIFVYLQTVDVNTRNQIIFIFQDLLKGSGFDISQLQGGGGGGGSTKINFNLGSLFADNPKAQAQIQIYLDKLSKDEQQKIFASFSNLGREAQIEYLLHLSGVNKGQVREGNISIVGGGGGGGSTTTLINLAQLFPNEPELQSKLQVFLGGLDQATQNKIFFNLGSLDANTQIQILRQLIQLSQTPGIITITINGEPITINNESSVIHVI